MELKGTIFMWWMIAIWTALAIVITAKVTSVVTESAVSQRQIEEGGFRHDGTTYRVTPVPGHRMIDGKLMRVSEPENEASTNAD